jgi:hypothetical protein
VITVVAIPAADLPLFWGRLWPFLERAAKRTNGGDEETVRGIIESGHAQLWGVLDASGVKPGFIAAASTQITLLDPRKGCRIWLIGGVRMGEWAAEFLDKIEPWARSLGCTCIWGMPSRAGWRRVVAAMGGEQIEMDGKPVWGKAL